MSQITEYNATEAGLAELRQRYAGIVFDLTSTKGNQEARAARKELVTLRTSLEAKRKELKAPALEHARLIDAEAARIKGEIEALEGPIDAQIKADEERREIERQAKAAKEAQRIAGHQLKLDGLRNIAPNAMGKDSAALTEIIDTVKETKIGAEWEEFQPIAERAKTETLDRLRDMLAKAQAAEAEAARIAAERAELERMRAEAAERERQLREQEESARREREAAEAASKAKREAAEAEARAKIEAEQREARERIEAAERQAKAERDAAEAAARAAREAQEAAERAQRRAEEDRLRAEREAAEARQREAEEVARKAREAEEAAQAEIRRQAQLRLDARAMLETFVERFGSLPEYEDIARDIAVFLNGQTQLAKVAA